MAPQRDLDKIGSEGFALIIEYFDRKRINRPPTTVEAHQSCTYRYILPKSLIYLMIAPTGREAMITAPTPPVMVLNSYEAAQLHDGIRLANYSKRRQMPMAY
ncbi:hypothetical protein H5410_004570 [Solanum commersonii]|uniref:Uncharacterized protein n=1 Tax=Solanum commersonii TaxID=4109 RepID=A0A9J6B7Q8_SOLCO|nr:hypothetical protein H5410_004570 [Solanum commersonii]